MGKKKKAKKQKTHEQDYKACRRDADLFWIAFVVAVVGLGFFKLSIWLRTPNDKTVHVVNHKTKRVIVDKNDKRRARGYSVNYSNK